VLVLIQARDTADGEWRVVAAATTDAAGNFGMPYPRGIFVEAQALVSLAPAEPVDVPIIPREKQAADRSISTDFLYLLIRHPFRPQSPCGKGGDCGCASADTPGRLPGFSDLIGSDAYSQDIGGSCVNLSKPNRTINEFAFQAIVRTSDPEIGRYQVHRIEQGLESADVSQVAALASGVSALRESATGALDAARAAAASTPNVQTTQNLAAIEAAHPHALALEGAFVPGGPPVTLTALSQGQTHVDGLTSVLVAVRNRLESQGFGLAPESAQVIIVAASLTALIRLAIDTVGGTVRYELTGDPVTLSRRPVSLTNPIEWQSAPEPSSGDPSAASASFAQAVSVATGHILHYKALFKADGYSLGDLTYSLPLAPGQKKEIVVFDATQTMVGAETQQLSQNERLAMGLVDERDIASTLAGRIGETLSGGSSANTSGVSAGGGLAAGGSMGALSAGGTLGISGGTSQSSANASQDGSRDVAQFFGEKLRQSIMQNAEGYRQLNASVVTTVQQGQRYGVTSEVVANHNHCHSLTIMYFEVLRHYAIFQELSAVEECVFVPFLLARFSSENIAVWRDVLAPALLPLPSETYLQPFLQPGGSGRAHPLVKAFDAVQRIRTSYANIDFPAGSYDEEPIRFMKGTFDLRISLPRPKTRYDRIKSLPMVTRTTQEVDLAATAKRAVHDSVLAGWSGGLSIPFTGPPGTNIEYRDVQTIGKQAIFDAFMTMDANFESVPPAECIRVTNFDPKSINIFGISIPLPGLDFFQDGNRDREQWVTYATLLGYSDVLAMLNYYFRGRLISEWDDIFENDILPLIFRKITKSLRLDEFAADFTAQSQYTGGDRIVSFTVSGTTTKTRNRLPAQLRFRCQGPAVLALADFATVDVQNVRLTYSTSHFTGMLYAGNPADDLLNGALLDIPEGAEERRNPRREDRYLAGMLVDHLNSHLEYYNRTLWNNLDPDRRFMLLDGFSVQIFGDDGLPVAGPAGLRSLASVVKNEVVTVAGNSLIFPVAPGYRVSGAMIKAKPPADDGDGDAETDEMSTLVDHYRPLTPIEPYRVSVPTKGTFAEAIQGACNSCEKIERDLLQDWSRFPTDEPTAVSPVTLSTPPVAGYQPNYRDFAAPIVNVQNTPATPAPGAGMAGLGEVLANSGVFRDITGLDATQQNAIRTYLSNQENAKAFAQMAKEMATQNHNTSNSGQIRDSITAARADGTITQDQASKLTEKHLQQQIDGGTSARTEAEAAQQAKTSPVTQIAADGVGQSRDVSYQRQDGDGNVESVTVGGEGTAGRLDVKVRGTVPALRQVKKNDCWAVVTAMLVNWKRGLTTITPAEAVAEAGARYLAIYEADTTGLLAEDKDDFLAHSELMTEPPMSFVPQDYATLLRTYGPLWITVDASPGEPFSPHALLLVQISGTGTPDGSGLTFTFLDPSTGGQVAKLFPDFVRSYEELARQDKDLDRARPQVVHFIERVDVGEGFEVEGPWNIHEPVHENLTLAGLRASGFSVPAGTRMGSDTGINEFLRGLLWNDDPALLFFHDDKDKNWRFTDGRAWRRAFNAAEKSSSNDLTNLTGRTHFYDLSYLHAMATAKDESPYDTLAKIMMWAEVTYRLATADGLNGAEKLSDVAITAQITDPTGTPHTARLSQFFTAATRPKGSDTVRFLLARDTRFTGVDLGRRAIGSLLHLIQDSYARGHVRRTLLNPGDLVADKTDEFKDGTWGRFGDVENFHYYRGQSEEHGHYDEVPKGVTLAYDDLTTFNRIHGARDAIEMSARVLSMWRAKTKWDSADGPRKLLLDKIFKLSPNVKPSDNTV
jgi:hypothetical protein